MGSGSSGGVGNSVKRCVSSEDSFEILATERFKVAKQVEAVLRKPALCALLTVRSPVATCALCALLLLRSAVTTWALLLAEGMFY